MRAWKRRGVMLRYSEASIWHRAADSEDPSGYLRMTRLGRLIALTVLFTTPLIALAPAHAAEVKPPVAATVPLRAGQPVRGQIVAFDAESVRLLAGESSLDVKWSDVKPEA